MTTEEKLKHFQTATMEAARAEGNSIIEEYAQALNQIFEDHKKDKLRQAELQIKLEAESLEREKNKELSKERLQIKRTLSQKQNELKEMLFVEVKNMLGDYMAKPAYNDLLIKQIKEAKEFAGNMDITIYIDPADSSRLYNLEAATQTNLTISEYSFMGGTRAVIPEKNILIDNSFESKFNQIKDEFMFNGGNSYE